VSQTSTPWPLNRAKVTTETHLVAMENRNLRLGIDQRSTAMESENRSIGTRRN
jgi:hypothetical protein